MAGFLVLSLCVTFASAASVPFECLKGLAGDWIAAEDGEMFRKGDVVSRYSVAASGSAVVETAFPGSPHEMVTVYHADSPPPGKRLISAAMDIT